MQSLVNLFSHEHVIYTGKTRTTGGRDGASQSSDSYLDIKLSTPGTSEQGTNPEQLFAAGWSACFISSVRIAASKMRVTLPPGLSVDAEVDLGSTIGNYFLQGRMKVNLPGMDPQTAKALADASHRNCPYSRATLGNINVEINVSV